MTDYSNTSPMPVQPVQPETVVNDHSCRKCGYNVRGLPLMGRCPECGTPVAVSIYGNLLRYSQPEYVLMLKRGISLIVAGIVTIIIAVIVAAVVTSIAAGAIARGGVGGAGPGPGILGLLIFLGVAILAGWVCMTIGWWLITTPDPSGVGEDKYGLSRKIIRIALIVGIANQALDLMLKYGTVPPELFEALQIASSIGRIVGVVGLFAQLNYLSKLALRMPDQFLANRARFLMWAFGLSIAALVGMGIIAALAGPSATTRGDFTGLACIMIILGLAVIVFAIMYLLMLDKLRRAITPHVAYARQHWDYWTSIAAGGQGPQANA